MTARDPGGSGTQAALRVAARLREDLERQINAVDETVRENSTALRELAATVAKLNGSGDKGDADELQPFWPGDLIPDEWALKRADLEEWVRDVLTPAHPHTAGRLPGCWVDHPAALEAVLSAYFAWHGAYRAKGRRLEDGARWLRDVLPALDKQLEAEFQPKPGATVTAARRGAACTAHPHHARSAS